MTIGYFRLYYVTSVLCALVGIRLVSSKHAVSKMLDYIISDQPDEYGAIRYDKTLRPNFGGDGVPVNWLI